MPTATTASDLGAAIRAARRARGLSQAQLAERAGVGRQWLVAIESGHERAEFGKVAQLLASLGLTFTVGDGSCLPSDGRTWTTAAETARVIRDEVARGDTNFALRALAWAVSDFRRLDDAGEIAAFLAEPPSSGDHRWDTLLGAAVSRECRLGGISPPDWTAQPPLATWWFPIDDPILTARTMQRTPIDLAVRGIWLDARALEVA